MLRTEAVMQTKLEGIGILARKDSKVKFTSLAHHLSGSRILENLRGMPRNTSKGVDGLSVDEAILTLDEWWPEVERSIHHRSYNAPPVRRVYIPKPGKSAKRPIGVPTVCDRALQKTTSDLLTIIYEADFLPCSFGGRPEKSAHQAVSTLRETLKFQRYRWVYEADLKNFFGSLDHQWAMKFFQERVADPRIINLMRRWLRAGVMEEGQIQNSTVGTPQGGPISVLMSNIYLHYVLDLWIERVVKPRLKGDVKYIRYLDDFVLCFQFEEDAIRLQQVLGQRLGKFGLELEPSKTKLFQLTHPRDKGPNGPGCEDSFSFLGFRFYWGKSRSGSPMLKLSTEKTRLSRGIKKAKDKLRKIRHLPLKDQQRLINTALVGHYRYFGVSCNYHALNKLYRSVMKYWRVSLSSRSQRGNVTWEKFNQILSLFPLSRPKIYLSFDDMKAMAVS